MHDLFAVAAPGLEPFVAAELGALGLGTVQPVPGGVGFHGGWDAVVAANLHLRTATRVLVRLGEFPAANFPALERRLERLPWEQLAPVGRPLRVALRTTAHKSRLYHTGAIAERVTLAIAARLGAAVELARVGAGDDDPDGAAPADLSDRPPESSPGGADLLLVIRLERDVCTVSADSSGEPLHRRGYRLATARAPLRPTLAAGLLAAAGWRPGEPLIDPFCGSGTIAIEAALQAAGRPAAALRGFACARWPALAGAYAELRAAAEQLSPGPGPVAPIAASDRDDGAIAAARANAQRAGVDAALALAVQPLAACQPPAARGLVLSNPPYGVRVGRGRTLRDLYAHIGHILKDRFAGWRVGLLCPPELRAHLGLPLRTVLRARNGGLAVELAVGEITGRSRAVAAG